MSKEVEIRFEIDDKIKQEAEVVLAKYGRIFEDGILLFMKETVKRGKIPFEIDV